MKYSIRNITFEAKSDWEAINTGTRLMFQKGIKEGKLIGHFENRKCVVSNIIIPQPK